MCSIVKTANVASRASLSQGSSRRLAVAPNCAIALREFILVRPSVAAAAANS
jgi:hypothetical protein